MADTYVWGLDIGGTKCALCAADRAGHICFRHQLATGDYPAWEALLEALLAAGKQNAPRPAAVGVSCGGPLDDRRGMILSPPNLPGWDQVPVTDWLKKRLGVPAYLQNDANACALAEWQYGAGQGCQSMVFLTFGTGLGAGLILDGRLYAGACGMAGEAGHIRMEKDGPLGYGKRGSLEGFCSGGGLARLARERLGRDISARELIALADAGDGAAADALRLSARMLGRGLAILVDLLNPERIVIGSIFARAERWFRDEMEAALREEALPGNTAVCRVLPAALGERLGDLAAVTTAWMGGKEQE